MHLSPGAPGRAVERIAPPFCWNLPAAMMTGPTPLGLESLLIDLGSPGGDVAGWGAIPRIRSLRLRDQIIAMLAPAIQIQRLDSATI